MTYYFGRVMVMLRSEASGMAEPEQCAKIEHDLREIDETLPFLDTYRTLCRAPEPAFRQILEDVRELGFAA
jgi:hypothetical protein